MGRLTPMERSLIVALLAVLAVGALGKYWRDRSQIRRQIDVIDVVELRADEGKLVEGAEVGAAKGSSNAVNRSESLRQVKSEI